MLIKNIQAKCYIYGAAFLELQGREGMYLVQRIACIC